MKQHVVVGPSTKSPSSPSICTRQSDAAISCSLSKTRSSFLPSFLPRYYLHIFPSHSSLDPPFHLSAYCFEKRGRKRRASFASFSLLHYWLPFLAEMFVFPPAQLPPDLRRKKWEERRRRSSSSSLRPLEGSCVVPRRRNSRPPSCKTTCTGDNCQEEGKHLRSREKIIAIAELLLQQGGKRHTKMRPLTKGYLFPP